MTATKEYGRFTVEYLTLGGNGQMIWNEAYSTESFKRAYDRMMKIRRSGQTCRMREECATCGEPYGCCGCSEVR